MWLAGRERHAADSVLEAVRHRVRHSAESMVLSLGETQSGKPSLNVERLCLLSGERAATLGQS